MIEEEISNLVVDEFENRIDVALLMTPIDAADVFLHFSNGARVKTSSLIIFKVDSKEKLICYVFALHCFVFLAL